MLNKRYYNKCEIDFKFKEKMTSPKYDFYKTDFSLSLKKSTMIGLIKHCVCCNGVRVPFEVIFTVNLLF